MCWHWCSQTLTGLRWKDHTSTWSMSQASQHGQTLHQKQAGKETGGQGLLTHEQALVTNAHSAGPGSQQRTASPRRKPRGRQFLGTGPSSGSLLSRLQTAPPTLIPRQLVLSLALTGSMLIHSLCLLSTIKTALSAVHKNKANHCCQQCLATGTWESHLCVLMRSSVIQGKASFNYSGSRAPGLRQCSL